MDQPVTVINAGMIAEQRRIKAQTVIASDQGEDRLAIEITSKSQVHHVEGAIYEDDLPRITHLDGYHMDMVPAGHMVVPRVNGERGNPIVLDDVARTRILESDANFARLANGAKQIAQPAKMHSITPCDDSACSNCFCARP